MNGEGVNTTKFVMGQPSTISKAWIATQVAPIGMRGISRMVAYPPAAHHHQKVAVLAAAAEAAAINGDNVVVMGVSASQDKFVVKTVAVPAFVVREIVLVKIVNVVMVTVVLLARLVVTVNVVMQAKNVLVRDVVIVAGTLVGANTPLAANVVRMRKTVVELLVVQKVNIAMMMAARINDVV